MTASLDLTKLLREMDKAFVQREPLPNHFIKPLDQHTRETYAAMLAAIMLADGNLQENQSRLFSLLCTALGLSDGQTKALHQSTQISSEHIVDFCRLAEEQNFAVSFLADSLILSRIDSPITHNQNQLLNQWILLLNLPISQIETAVTVSATIVGLKTNLSAGNNIVIDQFQVWSEYIQHLFVKPLVTTDPIVVDTEIIQTQSIPPKTKQNEKNVLDEYQSNLGGAIVKALESLSRYGI